MFILTCFSFQTSDEELPVCSPNSVCNKIDTYATPYVDKLCRCPASSSSSGRRSTTCSTSTHARDGHTISDRTKQFKVRAKKNGERKYGYKIQEVRTFFSTLFPNVSCFSPTYTFLSVFPPSLDLRACEALETLQVFQGRKPDSDLLPRQLHPANHALPLPQERRHLLDQEPGLRYGPGNWNRVQLRLFTPNGKNNSHYLPSNLLNDVIKSSPQNSGRIGFFYCVFIFYPSENPLPT